MSILSRREVVAVIRQKSSIAHAAVAAMLHDLFVETASSGIPADPVTLSLMIGMLGDDAGMVAEVVELLKVNRFLMCEGDRLLSFEDRAPVVIDKPRAKKNKLDSDQKKHTAIPRLQLSTYVFMSEEHRDKWTDELGTKNFLRCVEKLDAWVGQDPTPKRIKNGYNADCTFRSWVVRSILGESNKPEPIAQKTNVSRALKELLGDE